MNYRKLLYKYLNHVGQCEGVTFVPRKNQCDFGFTKEELACLYEIEEMREYNESDSDQV